MLSFCSASVNYICQNLIIQPVGRQFPYVLYDGLLVFRIVLFASMCSVWTAQLQIFIFSKVWMNSYCQHVLTYQKKSSFRFEFLVSFKWCIRVWYGFFQLPLKKNVKLCDTSNHGVGDSYRYKGHLGMLFLGILWSSHFWFKPVGCCLAAFLAILLVRLSCLKAYGNS